MNNKGRPPIDRETARLRERLTAINAGLLACYETIEIGQRKKAAVEMALREHDLKAEVSEHGTRTGEK